MSDQQYGFKVEIEFLVRAGSYIEALTSAMAFGDRLDDDLGGGAACIVVRETGETLLQGTPGVFCEGCEGCVFPGIRWPTQVNDDSTREWCERCDHCGRYGSDFDAAEALQIGRASCRERV